MSSEQLEYCEENGYVVRLTISLGVGWLSSEFFAACGFEVSQMSSKLLTNRSQRQDSGQTY